MDRKRTSKSFTRYKKKHPLAISIAEYQNSSTPSKHNTIFNSEDECFLKEIYKSEQNTEWRKMCLADIHDQDFLEHVAKTDKNERVRKEAARKCKSHSLISWLKDNDHSKLVRDYAKARYAKLPNSMKFIIS